jgi:hypothetical protein
MTAASVGADPGAGFRSAPDLKEVDLWPEPDMRVLQIHRREPPPCPVDLLGSKWAAYLRSLARGASCPVDYPLGALLALASSLIGHARWVEVAPDWQEPPHQWVIVVGDSGQGKSPGSRGLLQKVLPVLERRAEGDFPEREAEWKAAVELEKEEERAWKGAVKTALKTGSPLPKAPNKSAGPPPQKPALREVDIGHEKLAVVLSGAP